MAEVKDIKISALLINDILPNVINNKTLSNFISKEHLPIQSTYIVYNSKKPADVFNLFKRLKIQNIMYSVTTPKKYNYSFVLENGDICVYKFDSSKNRKEALSECLYLLQKKALN